MELRRVIFLYLFDSDMQKFKKQPIPFILINEKIENNQTKYEFELNRNAVDLFATIKNKKIAVATVAGPQRSGKSFLSNRLLKRMKGFAIGPSTNPCTKGIWIWGQPIQLKDDTVLIIMDTQGLNSVQRNINIDLKIFSLSILLSSVFLYNSLGHIDEKAIQNMSYVLRMSENIRVKQVNQSDGEISKCFPIFYWVLRDFSLDLKDMTENQYLQKALRPVSNDEKEEKNIIRSKIRKLFTIRNCECFPRPINDEDKLAYIQELKYQDLRQKFRDKMNQFEMNFFETVTPKLINGKPLTGDIYLNLVRQYIDAINSGKVPQVLNSLERVLEAEARQITQGLQNNYKQAMNKVAKPDKPIDQIILQRNHRQFVRKIQEKFDLKFKDWLEVGKTGEYKNKLFDWLEKDYKERTKKNQYISNLLCTEFFKKKFLQQYFVLPKIESVDGLPDSYFKQKLTQCMEKIKKFVQTCKAPQKFVFFIKKFPQATLQFFDLFFARIKGVHTTQVNKLKAQNRNSQADLESFKRIMIETEALLKQKQKEVDSITYEKQMLRKQLEKIKRMEVFQKQTGIKNQSQLKKQVKSFKNQIQQLQQQNQQLKQHISKFKNELSTKKLQLSQMIKKESVTYTTTNSENIPGEVISGLGNLKDKLSSIKDFYDKKVSDDTIDNDIIKQIENIRTEKHIAIQKIKEQYKVKNEDNRKKFSKSKEEYEKSIRLLNKYIEDIKTENMQLEKRSNEIPGSEKSMKGVLSELKNLKESVRLKQNNINSLIALNNQKQRKMEDIEASLAIMKAESANFESYKETFPFILRESLNWVQNKNNKLKHSIKTLAPQDFQTIKAVFKELSLNPF